jgi:hypothetical protein
VSEAPPSGAIDLPQDCPQCAQQRLEMVWTLVAHPIGTFSLAGAQMKFSASVVAVVRCHNCGFRAQGRLEDATMAEDGLSFTGGHFVADR